MKGKKFELDLLRYLSGEMPGNEREGFERKLADDERSARSSEEAGGILDEAARLPRRAPREGFETRVLHAVRRGAGPGFFHRVRQALFTPRISFSPITALVAAAALFVTLTLPLAEKADPPPRISGKTPPSESLFIAGVADGVPPETGRVLVRFLIEAPEAENVSIVGDFNDWRIDDNPLKSSGETGFWSTTLALPRGIHNYMFVIDGETWVPDPAGEEVMDDGFGLKNSVLKLL